MLDWSSLRGRLIRWVAGAAACVALSTTAGGTASAQEIEPNEFVPAPAGVNLAIGYYLYGHNEDYNIAKGPTIKKSGLEVNVGIARLVHYFDVAGHPAGIQVLEAFGSESAGHIGSTSLGSAFGASNTILSAFIWPYASTEKKQYLIIAGFILPPVGTYDKYAALNLASAFGYQGWSGDVQLGWDQGIGDHFSYDVSVDFRAFGDTTAPGGLRNTKDNDYRFQAWANWNWTRAFQTSIGYEGFIGGEGQTNGVFNGSKSENERVRAAASLFVAPNAQILLEVNHEFVSVGGFKQTFGATGRVVYIF